MKAQTLPEIDDEFAKKLGYDTVPALREAVERNLVAGPKRTPKSAQVEKIIGDLVAGST